MYEIVYFSEIMGSIGGILAAILWMGINASFVQAHREHKVGVYEHRRTV